MSGDARARGELAVPARRGGPELLLLPLLFAVGAVWWVRQPTRSDVPSRPPPREDPEATQEVLYGEFACAGATLTCWLAPADLAPERREFQSRALQKRYGLADGEAWRLRLELRPQGAALESGAGEQDAAAPEAPGSPVSLAAGDLAIEDARGRALAPLALAPLAPERAMDPLAALLAPPAEPLTVGTSLDLILWGRTPGPEARLVGLPASLAAPCALAARPVRSGDLVGPMARLDPSLVRPAAPTGGKSAAAGASQAAGRGTDDARY